MSKRPVIAFGTRRRLDTPAPAALPATPASGRPKVPRVGLLQRSEVRIGLLAWAILMLGLLFWPSLLDRF